MTTENESPYSPMLCIDIDGTNHILEANASKGMAYISCDTDRVIVSGDLASFIMTEPDCMECVDAVMQKDPDALFKGAAKF